MDRMKSGVLLLIAAALFPAPVAAQFVIRDDVAGWGWLTFVNDRRAIVQLAYGSPENGDQGRLDAALLADLRTRGVRRLWDASGFDATESQVLAECTAIDQSAEGSATVTFGLHTEISYWDHTRLAATEIYEALSLGSLPREGFTTDTYVQSCSRLLSDVLFRLGFDEG